MTFRSLHQTEPRPAEAGQLRASWGQEEHRQNMRQKAALSASSDHTRSQRLGRQLLYSLPIVTNACVQNKHFSVLPVPGPFLCDEMQWLCITAKLLSILHSRAEGAASGGMNITLGLKPQLLRSGASVFLICTGWLNHIRWNHEFILSLWGRLSMV